VPRDLAGKVSVNLEISPLVVIDDADAKHYCQKENINKIFNLAKEKRYQLFNIHHSDVKKISTEISPQGIIAIANRHTFSLPELKGNILILDKIKDPRKSRNDL